VSILWFSKIKQILEYKKFSESLKNEQEDDLDNNNSAIDVVEKFENSNQILRTMRSVTERAERQIDILFAQYLIQKNEIIKFINFLVGMTRKNKILNIRILLPSPKFDNKDIPSH
jgi:predicted CoA-binding protein